MPPVRLDLLLAGAFAKMEFGAPLKDVLYARIDIRWQNLTKRLFQAMRNLSSPMDRGHGRL